MLLLRRNSGRYTSWHCSRADDCLPGRCTLWRLGGSAGGSIPNAISLDPNRGGWNSTRTCRWSCTQSWRCWRHIELANASMSHNIRGNLPCVHNHDITSAFRPAKANRLVCRRQLARIEKRVGHTGPTHDRVTVGLVAESTAKVAPALLPSNGALAPSKTLPSMRTFVPSLTSNAWPVLLCQELFINVPVAVQLQPRRAVRGVVNVVSSERHLIILSIAKLSGISIGSVYSVQTYMAQ